MHRAGWVGRLFAPFLLRKRNRVRGATKARHEAEFFDASRAAAATAAAAKAAQEVRAVFGPCGSAQPSPRFALQRDTSTPKRGKRRAMKRPGSRGTVPGLLGTPSAAGHRSREPVLSPGAGVASPSGVLLAPSTPGTGRSRRSGRSGRSRRSGRHDPDSDLDSS